MIAPPLYLPDTLPPREVAFAVELLDPVNGSLVSQGITVSVAGRVGPPIPSLSGRFVWIGQVERWPDTLSVFPGQHPFEPVVNFNVSTQRPAQWPNVPPQQRVVRVRLRPTSSYPFGDGVTAIRGGLFEADAAGGRRPVPGARVGFEWAVQGTATLQPIDSALRVTTDTRGEFAVYDRVRKTALGDPAVSDGLLAVRVVVTREGATARRTPAGFQFLPKTRPAGRVPEGTVLPTTIALSWEALT